MEEKFISEKNIQTVDSKPKIISLSGDEKEVIFKGDLTGKNITVNLSTIHLSRRSLIIEGNLLVDPQSCLRSNESIMVKGKTQGGYIFIDGNLFCDGDIDAEFMVVKGNIKVKGIILVYHKIIAAGKITSDSGIFAGLKEKAKKLSIFAPEKPLGIKYGNFKEQIGDNFPIWKNYHWWRYISSNPEVLDKVPKS